MARKPNPVKSVQITVSTTPLVHGYLSALVDTGLYGKNPAEAAERLIAKGVEVQRRLSGISPSTRVIVLTANDDRIVRWKALAAGAAAFFIKPQCGDEFLAGVRSAFAAN